eukprot:TRINITY_DN138_c1_g5_i1.p3 TRINITY_DN138_c1_g5~~TRINITY_DN138_c1_g5_i1.p3  ORF type:complete len:131 (+),score=2.22 TRINITY_DN138_c1_g5_i1:225-617(+)
MWSSPGHCCLVQVISYGYTGQLAEHCLNFSAQRGRCSATSGPQRGGSNSRHLMQCRMDTLKATDIPEASMLMSWTAPRWVFSYVHTTGQLIEHCLNFAAHCGAASGAGSEAYILYHRILLIYILLSKIYS